MRNNLVTFREHFRKQVNIRRLEGVSFGKMIFILSLSILFGISREWLLCPPAGE
jgi:hypothetical protein